MYFFKHTFIHQIKNHDKGVGIINYYFIEKKVFVIYIDKEKFFYWKKNILESKWYTLYSKGKI